MRTIPPNLEIPFRLSRISYTLTVWPPHTIILHLPKCLNPSHCVLLWVLRVRISSFTVLGSLWWILWWNFCLLKHGALGWSRSQSVEMRMPCWISLLAATVVLGVRWLSMPNSSLGPKSPHALPRGPEDVRGRESKLGYGEGAGDMMWSRSEVYQNCYL